jgi:hypothetical protein
MSKYTEIFTFRGKCKDDGKNVSCVERKSCDGLVVLPPDFLLPIPTEDGPDEVIVMAYFPGCSSRLLWDRQRHVQHHRWWTYSAYRRRQTRRSTQL